MVLIHGTDTMELYAVLGNEWTMEDGGLGAKMLLRWSISYRNALWRWKVLSLDRVSCGS